MAGYRYRVTGSTLRPPSHAFMGPFDSIMAASQPLQNEPKWSLKNRQVVRKLLCPNKNRQVVRKLFPLKNTGGAEMVG